MAGYATPPASWQLVECSVRIPISRVGIGIANVTFTRTDATDTVRARCCKFGDDIPLLTYEEMLSELRYFAAPDRLRLYATLLSSDVPCMG